MRGRREGGKEGGEGGMVGEGKGKKSHGTIHRLPRSHARVSLSLSIDAGLRGTATPVLLLLLFLQLGKDAVIFFLKYFVCYCCFYHFVLGAFAFILT